MLSTFFKPIILQRPFCAIAGVLGGLLLTQAVNYELLLNSGNSFASQTYQQWQKDTAMTREEIDAALAIAVEQNLIQVDTSTQKHYPELIRFRVNHSVVDAKLSAIGEVVEPEKKEPIKEKPVATEEKEQLVLIPPEQVDSTSLIASGRTRTDFTKLSDADITKVFLAAYKENKPDGFTNHTVIPKDVLKKVKSLIADYPFDALQVFVNALTVVREQEDDWWRRPNNNGFSLQNLMTNGKMYAFNDKHIHLMETDPAYRSRVEGKSPSKDMTRTMKMMGIDPSLVPLEELKEQSKTYALKLKQMEIQEQTRKEVEAARQLDF